MRPVGKTAPPQSVDASEAQDSDDGGEDAVQEMQHVQDVPSDLEGVSDGEYNNAIRATVRAKAKKSPKAKDGHTKEKEKKAPARRKVKADAHANYRALKIKNKNSKGKGGGRFGRRR